MASRDRRPTGDDATNARKRYYRAAQRHLKNAEKLVGVSADRERVLAKIQFEKALDTYDPETNQRMAKPIRELANEFGVDLQQRRREITSGKLTEKQKERRIEQMREIRIKAISEEESSKATETALKDPEKRAEYEPNLLYSNQSFMSRLLAGTVDVWREYARDEERDKIDTSKIMEALYREYHVSTFEKLVMKLESLVGNVLYAPLSDESYDVVKLSLQFTRASRRAM